MHDDLIARMAGGGPHEWGYRDVADGTFISDPWPFHAVEALDEAATHLANVLFADPGPKAHAAIQAATEWWNRYDAAIRATPPKPDRLNGEVE